jgi:benzil reductase ((S)-benzoin forming)
MKNVLITGTSSGLGYSLAKEFKDGGYNVYGISRSFTDLDINKVECDFNDIGSIESALNSLVDVDNFSHIILNAGILGKVAIQKDITIPEYNEIFNVNVLSNKIILDSLLNKSTVESVIGISSGAAHKTYFGWGLYCCSKAAFSQLLTSYSDEFKDVNFVSLRPGLVKTKMQDEIHSYDINEFPSLKKFNDAYPTMSSPSDTAKLILKHIDVISNRGGYVNLGDIT